MPDEEAESPSSSRGEASDVLYRRGGSLSPRAIVRTGGGGRGEAGVAVSASTPSVPAAAGWPLSPPEAFRGLSLEAFLEPGPTCVNGRAFLTLLMALYNLAPCGGIAEDESGPFPSEGCDGGGAVLADVSDGMIRRGGGRGAPFGMAVALEAEDASSSETARDALSPPPRAGKAGGVGDPL